MYLLGFFFFFSSRRRHTRFDCDWSSDVCSSDLLPLVTDMNDWSPGYRKSFAPHGARGPILRAGDFSNSGANGASPRDRKSTRLNSSHSQISYAVFCLKKKKNKKKGTSDSVTSHN